MSMVSNASKNPMILLQLTLLTNSQSLSQLNNFFMLRVELLCCINCRSAVICCERVCLCCFVNCCSCCVCSAFFSIYSKQLNAISRNRPQPMNAILICMLLRYFNFIFLFSIIIYIYIHCYYYYCTCLCTQISRCLLTLLNLSCLRKSPLFQKY